MSPLLQDIFVGRPRHIDEDEPWETAFYKQLVTGSVSLRVDNLDGDGQADRSVHGGPDKAVCVYSADHYDDWRHEVKVDACGPGWFGENFSIAHQTEGTVALGDVYRIGTALVQVSQPRGPCWKLARRWRRPDMVKRVVESGRSGWYVRVLEEGVVAAGETLVLEDRPYAQWTIATVNTLTYVRGRDARQLQDIRRALAACPVLAASWRADLLASA